MTTTDDRESRLAEERLSAALDEVARLEEARQTQADVVSRLLADRAELTTSLETARQEFESARQELEAARQELEAARQELAEIRATRLWRWSAPPRRVYRWLRIRFRRA